jgi:hypothetical protein
MALSGSALPGQPAPPATAASPAARLTGRGAVLGMAMVFTVGLLAASWLGATVLAGILFVLGCALAARFTRPTDLLIVVLTPPILFCGALIFVEAVTAPGSLFLSVAAGSLVVLVSLPLWLAAGLVVTVAIAVPRGLLGSVGYFLRDLRADGARSKAAWARRKAVWARRKAVWASRQRAPGGLPRRPPPRRAPAVPAGPGARRPGGGKAAAGPGPRGTTAGPGSRGTIRVAGSAPRGPGSTRAAAPMSRGPGKAAGPTPRPGMRRAAPQAPQASESADRAADAR